MTVQPKGKLEFPNVGTWRKCNKCDGRIMILQDEFWRIDKNYFYHIKCQDIVRFAK